MSNQKKFTLSAKAYINQRLSPLRIGAFIARFDNLSIREKDCLARHVLNLEEIKEIGGSVGLSAVRVGQIVSKAQRKVARRLEDVAMFQDKLNDCLIKIRQLEHTVESLNKQIDIKAIPISDIYATEIEDMELSVRLYNVLCRNRKRTIADIMTIRSDEFLRFRGAGKATFVEMEHLLFVKYGLIWPNN